MGNPDVKADALTLRYSRATGGRFAGAGTRDVAPVPSATIRAASTVLSAPAAPRIHSGEHTQHWHRRTRAGGLARQHLTISSRSSRPLPRPRSCAEPARPASSPGRLHNRGCVHHVEQEYFAIRHATTSTTDPDGERTDRRPVGARISQSLIRAISASSKWGGSPTACVR